MDFLTYFLKTTHKRGILKILFRDHQKSSIFFKYFFETANKRRLFKNNFWKTSNKCKFFGNIFRNHQLMWILTKIFFNIHLPLLNLLCIKQNKFMPFSNILILSAFSTIYISGSSSPPYSAKNLF